MPDYQPTVGTEAMSDRARPRSLEGVRMVEEGRENEKPLKRAPYVRDPNFAALAYEMQWIEALAEGREKLAVVGPLCDDGEPKFGDGTCEASSEYAGSHSNLGGIASRQADLSLWARKMLRLVAEEAEKLE